MDKFDERRAVRLDPRRSNLAGFSSNMFRLSRLLATRGTECDFNLI